MLGVFKIGCYLEPRIIQILDQMNQGNINLLIRSNIVTKEDICNIYQNMWKSPRGVLWFYEKYGPCTLTYCLRKKIAYPLIGYNYHGQLGYTKEDYEWAKNLFRTELPVPYDEETKNFLAELFPPDPYDDIGGYMVYVELMKEIDPKFKQDCEKLHEIIDDLRKKNVSGCISIDKMELIPESQVLPCMCTR